MDFFCPHNKIQNIYDSINQLSNRLSIKFLSNWLINLSLITVTAEFELVSSMNDWDV